MPPSSQSAVDRLSPHPSETEVSSGIAVSAGTPGWILPLSTELIGVRYPLWLTKAFRHASAGAERWRSCRGGGTPTSVRLVVEVEVERGSAGKLAVGDPGSPVRATVEPQGLDVPAVRRGADRQSAAARQRD